MPCRHCGQPETIESHVIPKGFFTQARGLGLKPVVIRRDRARKVQGLPFSKTILCRRCDGFLGKFDDYAIKIQREITELSKQPQHAGPTKSRIDMGHLQIDKLERFVLSVFWRAHHAAEEAGNNFQFPKFESEVSRFIFEDNSTRPAWMSICAIKMQGQNKSQESLTMFPKKYSWQGMEYWAFTVNSLAFIADTGTLLPMSAGWNFMHPQITAKINCTPIENSPFAVDILDMLVTYQHHMTRTKTPR
jgi:hypothetical protein